MYPDRRDRQPQRLLEQVGSERLRWWGQTGRTTALGGRIQTDHGMEVDRTPALELGHLGIGDPHEPAQLALLEADQPAKRAVHGNGGPAPQLRGQAVP
jgi:hypothetical protein